MLSPEEQIVTEGNSSSVVGFAASCNRIFLLSFKIGLSPFDLQSSDCQVGLPVIVAGDTQVDREGEAKDKENSRPSVISYTWFPNLKYGMQNLMVVRIAQRNRSTLGKD